MKSSTGSLTHEAKSAVSLLADVVNVGLPTEVALDGDSKVLGLINYAEGRPMDGILGVEDVLALVGNAYHLTLVRVKGHKPFLFPYLEILKVSLQGCDVILRMDWSVQKAIVSEETDL